MNADPKGPAKSVVFTDEGARVAEACSGSTSVDRPTSALDAQALGHHCAMRLRRGRDHGTKGSV